MKLKSFLFAVSAGTLAVLVLPLLGGRTQEDAKADISSQKLEYKPGAAFPPGFPFKGSVKLLSEPVVEAGAAARVRFEVRLKESVEQGGSVEIWRHFISDVADLQTDDAGAPGFFDVHSSNRAVQLKREVIPAGEVNTHRDRTFPYSRYARVAVEQGKLNPDDVLIFDLGGKHGVRMQYYVENLVNFRVALRDAKEKLAGYAGDASLRLIGGPARGLRVTAPSLVTINELFLLEWLPIDAWGNAAKEPYTAFQFQVEGMLGPVLYDQTLRHFVMPNLKLERAAVHRLHVRTTDGKLSALSNPILVVEKTEKRLFFGDMHQHTYLADGRGVFEELYLYARRNAMLDFGAITEHQSDLVFTGPRLNLEDYKYSKDYWPELQEVTKRFNNFKGFISILGYEYSVGTNMGGHHNMYFPTDQSTTVMHILGRAHDHIDKALLALKNIPHPTLVIPHIGGGPPKWDHEQSDSERLFEIASVHGVFEESFQKHLAHGWKLGASASGDTHTPQMGNSYPGITYVMKNALTGVYVDDKSRSAIWDGLWHRRTYGVTGAQRMILDTKVNGVEMGSTVPAARQARIQARVCGTAPILRLDVVKNGAAIYSVSPLRRPNGNLLRVVWGDNIYQRRAFNTRFDGRLASSRGRVELEEILALDQGFEWIQQQGDAVIWNTSAVSNDRDGILVDVSEVKEGNLTFRLDDSEQMGLVEIEIPVAELRQKGYFAAERSNERVESAYLRSMGVKPTFFLYAELVDPKGPMDQQIQYVDLEAKPGDYYYVRVEQYDTNKAWSSPVWIGSNE